MSWRRDKSASRADSVERLPADWWSKANRGAHCHGNKLAKNEQVAEQGYYMFYSLHTLVLHRVGILPGQKGFALAGGQN